VERVTSRASAERLPVLLAPGPASGAGVAARGGRFAAPIAYPVFGLVDILVFGLRAHGPATFAFTPEIAKVTVPNLVLPAAATCYVCGGITLALAGVRLLEALGPFPSGAFCAAIATSVTGSLWLGLFCGALAGSLVAMLLALFAIAYTVDQVVPGVVLNTLVLGLTGYLYNAIMVPYGNMLNNPATFNLLKIPLLGDIPIIGPVFFDSTVFLYITYALLAVVQVGLFRTRWGLRTRAVGEHPVAADTVGVRVIATRYRNVILSGLIAGIGGAYFTIGSVGSFGPDMSSGEGYIALAAMIFGRHAPFGAAGAALLFGFTTQLQSILSSINVPIQSNLLLLTPYVVTIIVVAGLVGKVRGPRAEGVPYIKS
jgi:ABC-type uncharacterized transport system permease subunit